MESSTIARKGIRAVAPLNEGSSEKIPTQGKLLSELLKAMADARPASGTRKLTAAEIGNALKLQGDDLARFIPLVVDASITSDGASFLQLKEDFRYKPHPDSRDLILRQVFRGTASPGKLEVDEGLAAVVGSFVKTNIKLIEEVTQENVRGVRVVAGLGTDFFPIEA